MDKLILGRYVPGQSILHRLDPRSKLLAMFAFILLVFWANNLVTNLLMLGFVLGLVVLSQIPFDYFIKGILPMLSVILFTTSFQLFFTPGGEPLVQFGIVRITDRGLALALLICARFILIILMSTLLTLTTTPLSLADAVESLLSPFKRFGLPAHEIGLMLSLSLRFVPTLMDDTTRIMKAQQARGVDFGEGNLIQKVKSVVPILIPLFASSFQRAEHLAVAMEARGYQGGDGRSKYRQLVWSWADSGLVLLFLGLGIALFFLKNP